MGFGLAEGFGLRVQGFGDLIPRIFVSHQWLSSVHPDPEGEKVKHLQQTLLGLIDGSLPVAEDIVSRSDDKSLSPNVRRRIADGFLFFDWFSIPQNLPQERGPNEDAALAVQSIPAYVELSNFFIAFVPALTHKDSSEPVNYATWLSRGWPGRCWEFQWF